MLVPWIIKRQTAYFLIFLFLALAVFGLAWLNINFSSCFDGKQNQKEKGVDCGGPCKKTCLGDIKNIIILWAQVFPAGNGFYDAVAVVDNPNLRLSSPEVFYRFKIYDIQNTLIASRSGHTFINPGEKFSVFESGIETNGKIPARAFIEFQPIEWEFLNKERHQLVVSGKEFVNNPKPSLRTFISNKSYLAEKNIEAVAFLYDEHGNAKAASASHIDYLAGGGSAEIVFTWPESFSQEPFSSEIFFRTGLAD